MFHIFCYVNNTLIVVGLGGDVRILLTMLRASLTKDMSEAKSQNRNNENSTFNFNTLD